VLSRSAIDKIGERLREDSFNVMTHAELTLFREQVAVKTKNAVESVRAQTMGVVNARNGKSSQAIVEKLHRQKTLNCRRCKTLKAVESSSTQ
jgi:hypothetical protein